MGMSPTSRKLVLFLLFLSPWLLISSGKKAVHSAVKEKKLYVMGRDEAAKAGGRELKAL